MGDATHTHTPISTAPSLAWGQHGNFQPIFISHLSVYTPIQWEGLIAKDPLTVHPSCPSEKHSKQRREAETRRCLCCDWLSLLSFQPLLPVCTLSGPALGHQGLECSSLSLPVDSISAHRPGFGPHCWESSAVFPRSLCLPSFYLI